MIRGIKIGGAKRLKTRGLISGNSSLGQKLSSLRGESQIRAKQSTLNRHTERSEVSKTRESNKNGESMTEKEINELDSSLQQNDSYNLDSCDLDCFGQSPRNDDKVA